MKIIKLHSKVTVQKVHITIQFIIADKFNDKKCQRYFKLLKGIIIFLILYTKSFYKHIEANRIQKIQSLAI